jgi:hypothetical protein
MQPYQKASKAMQTQGISPIKAAGSAIGAATTLGGGGVAAKLLQKAIPLLSSFIPVEQAMSGLSKLDPRLGSFINTAMENGKPFEEVRDFLSDKIDESIPKQSDDKEKVNKKWFSYLESKVKKLIDQGLSPAQAAVSAKSSERNKGIIKSIEEDYKKDFVDVIEELFGSGMMAQAQNIVAPQESTAALQPKGQTQQQAPGQGQQALMGILQKIAQARGAQ